MTNRGIAIACCLVLLGSVGTPVAAQRISDQRAGLAPALLVGRHNPAAAKIDSVRPNHWGEGMLIGAGVGAVVGLVLTRIGNGISDTSVNGSGIILVSMVVFSLVGGLIGSSRPKN